MTGGWLGGSLQASWPDGAQAAARLPGSAAQDLAFVLLVALGFPAVRLLLDRTVFEALAHRALRTPGYKKTDEPSKPEEADNLEKFKETAYKCLVQVLLISVLLSVSIDQPWFSDSRLFWSSCTRLPCDVTVSLGERFVYCLELGFYLQALPMLYLWEAKRKDRWASAAHHAATIILIAYSYYLNLTRVGVMVLVCHEANDIFLEAAKMARYAKKETLTTVMFVVFTLSWFVTRVTIYPAFIIRSCIYEAHHRVVVEVGKPELLWPHWEILTGFLIFLYCLHVYWSYLILRIAYRALTEGAVQDVREGEGGAPPDQAARSEAEAPTAAAAAGPSKRRGGGEGAEAYAVEGPGGLRHAQPSMGAIPSKI